MASVEPTTCWRGISRVTRPGHGVAREHHQARQAEPGHDPPAGLQEAPDQEGQKQPCQPGHAGKQAHLEIARPQPRQEDRQEWSGRRGQPHADGVDLDIAEIAFSDLVGAIGNGICHTTRVLQGIWLIITRSS